jgi:hypothetical protein
MADINEPILKAAHEHSMRNREVLAQGGECGCFHCLQTFDADEVIEWVDGGATALCPRCHIDSVLSSQTDPIDPAFLRRMHSRWFEQTAKLDLTAELAKLQAQKSDSPTNSG